MIPKIIHYCWFGRGEKDDMTKAYIAQWKNILTDYEFIEWNEDNFDVNYCSFTKEAYIFKNYAFVSDVCRLKALYEMGGIYLDTDVEVLKPFDEYLSKGSFCSYEGKWIGTAAIGTEPRQEWVKAFLDYYTKRHFLNAWGHPVRMPNTKILTIFVLPNMTDGRKPNVYPTDYFCAKDWKTNTVKKTENTVCVHHYACTWKRKRKTAWDRIRLFFKGIAVRYFYRQ